MKNVYSIQNERETEKKCTDSEQEKEVKTK